MPDHYADAVRDRRAELRERRTLLVGCRGEIRTQLALARIDGAAEVAAGLARLGREIRGYPDRADRRTLRELPRLVATAVAVLDAESDTRRTRVLAALRVIAGERGLLPGLGWPAAPAAAPEPVIPAPPAPAGLVDGAGSWRLAVPVVGLLGLPVLGLPAGGLAGTLLAAAAATALLAGLAAGRTAADRGRWCGWGEEVLAALRLRALTDLDTWLVALESRVSPELDRAAAGAVATVDAELAELAPAVPGAR